MTTDTLDTAARALGPLFATPSGRAAVRSLGLTGPEAPVFRCALDLTTVGEVMGDEAATVLVIDVERGRIATLHVPARVDMPDLDAIADTPLGEIVDGLPAVRGSGAPVTTGGIRGAVVQLVA